MYALHNAAYILRGKSCRLNVYCIIVESNDVVKVIIVYCVNTINDNIATILLNFVQ